MARSKPHGNNRRAYETDPEREARIAATIEQYAAYLVAKRKRQNERDRQRRLKGIPRSHTKRCAEIDPAEIGRLCQENEELKFALGIAERLLLFHFVVG